MSIRQLVVGITFAAVFSMSARLSVDTDTWWHLRAGKWMVEHGAILQEDIFSYTRAGSPWNYPGWLVEAPMYWIYRYFGPGGLNLWTAAMATLAFVFVWKTLSGGVFLRAFTVILAATVSGVYWAARPYLVTFCLAAVYLWALEGHRWGRFNRLWLLPLLMAVWANSHGGFMVGLLIWGCYWSAEILRGGISWLQSQRVKESQGNPGQVKLVSPQGVALSILGAALGLAVCLNPSGPAMLLYPFKTVSIGALQDYVQEWQSPNFHSLSVQPFIWLLLATLGTVGASKRRLAMVDFLLLSLFVYLGLMAGRNLALFALVSPMVLTRHAALLIEPIARQLGWSPSEDGSFRRGRRLVNLALLALALLAAGTKANMVFPARVNEEHFRATLPVEAVSFLRQNLPPGKLFNPYNWGGYLLWALPEYPVFIDGRTDLYDDEIINEWLRVARVEPGWEQILDRYGINLVLVEEGALLQRTLAGHAAWEQIYTDELAAVFRRKG